jgi:cytochrome c peroxidase
MRFLGMSPPIEHPKEMDASLDQAIQYLNSNSIYGELFANAFGDPQITSERVSLALAQFVRSLVSYRSKFDVGMAQVDSIHLDFPNFSKEENEGKTIFLGREESVRGNCASCHLTRSRRGQGRGRGNGRLEGKFAIFMGPQPQNNGLDRTIDKKDNGVGDQTDDDEDMGLFKSPSLRNVELTAPYMHDGRFKSLTEVIDHYSRNVKAHPNLHARLVGRGGRSPRQMELTSSQKRALIAFLETLTDHEFVKDPRFANPFK